MEKHAAFIRGINVGGVVLKMDTLKKIFAGLGFTGIETYIQSGNVIFSSAEKDTKALESLIRGKIREEAGIDAAVLVRNQAEMKEITSGHPFGETSNKNGLYVTLLQEIPQAGSRMDDTPAANEKFLLNGKILYSYYGDGYGRSKHDNNYLERILKVTATTRNWNTMNRMMDILNR